MGLYTIFMPYAWSIRRLNLISNLNFNARLIDILITKDKTVSNGVEKKIVSDYHNVDSK